ncbi:BREX-1 system adenine-specific DNA-methyltransferase PglX [Thalassospira sp. MCCC 1A01428]|uniref:BREX-1 system adenine-specific DNA-methyltransferase PglX n=1 Tax=Thalassospira sp. MCCC 1A01428 TaxID=1470575 RepID=UPI000A1E6B14|nr:BREX-1 system adenine-specific DNA-methyltransferase PglX [Thalassospira sp. MCCC 1A01428]OSQ35817.1 type IIS restriction endonuclease [Thalassospira sp. MCCC 1A01428]
METTKLKKFAQFARRNLIEQVSSKLKLVLAESSAARRERAEAVKKLEEAIRSSSKEQVIERVAYIWFNRFCALRFMDVNRYNRVNIVSPADPGQFQPEILAEAKMGHVDEEMVPEKTRQQIFALLDGKAPSRDAQGEAYRLLVVAACNFWNKAMPFLFQRIDDYTELLMPDDLLSGNAILAYTREAMTPNACDDVEVIGWLYQFYISEKKDEVFNGLKKNKKITPKNIPAATQLFTPHWIVRYLVENSLGRLWLLNRPGSKLIEQMDYYIKPEQAETDFLRIGKLEEIKICDPACGSGHMLTYAFDLLYAIYEEEGYEPAEIPEKILTHNLYGIEIDERAGELAAFALSMKARGKQRRFFSKGVKPNICVLENVHFDEGELKSYMDFVGRDLFTAQLASTLRQFEEADNFGSLIRPEVTDVWDVLEFLETKDFREDGFYNDAHKNVLKALRQAEYLSPKYHVVIANPPYMGGKGMNGRLGAWLKDNYSDVKSDLFSAFIVRNTELALPKGQLGFMSPFVWMFISSYEKLRGFLINQKTITSLIQLEYSGFDGATVPICTFTVENEHRPDFKGGYVRLSDFRGSENQAPRTLEAIKNPDCGWFYRASAADFKKIPGSPIVYSASDELLGCFGELEKIEAIANCRAGLTTGDNTIFQREWSEISRRRLSTRSESRMEAEENGTRWFPCSSGGNFRKWYGNLETVVNWEADGKEICSFAAPDGRLKASPRSREYYFREGFTWSKISSGKFSPRYLPTGCIFDDTGQSGFPLSQNVSSLHLVALACSSTSQHFLSFISQTLSFNKGDIAKIPVPNEFPDVGSISLSSIQISRSDWDSYETSWDFTCLPLLNPDYRQPTLRATYQKLRAHWWWMTLEMQRLEEENNRIFIDAYGLQDELAPEVPLSEITLTCNPHYRYGNDKSEDELEALLLADTMRELVSYAVGCMFGRYALDKPGLILANQGEGIADYLRHIPEPSFPADDDNVIPMLDGDWFTDDIAERFRKFLRVAFGDEHYEENLRFIEQALGKNGKARDIRDYFLKDFYNDHVKRYKKRPIYWLFSSPKGSFNALIYMHRYRSDTASVVLNDYLREFRTKLAAHKNHLEAVSISASASQAEKTKALKEIEKITKMIAEMEDYEREVLYPLATEQVEIDLDDGVKVNYPKLGAGLKKIVGLDAKGDS